MNKPAAWITEAVAIVTALLKVFGK